MLDVTGNEAIVALPGIITRDVAIGFQIANGDLFKLMPNSEAWIVGRGLTACHGITSTTVIVLVALDRKDSFFELFRTFVTKMVTTLSSSGRTSVAHHPSPQRLKSTTTTP